LLVLSFRKFLVFKYIINIYAYLHLVHSNVNTISGNLCFLQLPRIVFWYWIICKDLLNRLPKMMKVTNDFLQHDKVRAISIKTVYQINNEMSFLIPISQLNIKKSYLQFGKQFTESLSRAIKNDYLELIISHSNLTVT
jgi:hypothetical protein